jgi:cytochrome c553
MFATRHAESVQRSFTRDLSQLSPGWWQHAILFRAICLLALLSPLSAWAQNTSAPPASAQTCVGCHGSSGAGSEAAGAPRIAGMNAAYLQHALGMFKAGTRASDVMQPVAKTLSDSDIGALASYFAAQNPPFVPSAHPAAPDIVAAGKTLAIDGGDNGVPACFSCHAAKGLGNGQRFPRIAGQSATFTVNRLHEFQARARTSTPKPGSMTELASKLTETQIRDAAAYLSVIPPG